MKDIKNILLTTDLSPNASVAFSHAAALARQHGAGLHIIYVNEPPALVVDDAAAAATYAAETERQQRQQFEDLVARLSTEEKGLTIVPLLRSGAPAKEIVAAAAQVGAGCIVMATHGRSGLARMLIGSVTEAVLQSSPCPVLCINSRVSPAAGTRDIVLPTDFSNVAPVAYDVALALAGQRKVKVHLVSVIHDKLRVEPNLPPNAESADWLLHEHKQAESRLTALAAELAAKSGVQVIAAVRHGDPVAEIVAAAGQAQAGLIVAATHGRSGFTRLLMGSVAEKLIRHSPIPVLCVRPSGQPGAQ